MTGTGAARGSPGGATASMINVLNAIQAGRDKSASNGLVGSSRMSLTPRTAGTRRRRGAHLPLLLVLLLAPVAASARGAFIC